VKNGTTYVKNGTLLREEWHLREKWHPFPPPRTQFGKAGAAAHFLCCCVKNGTLTW
jgi:hypothetical protein